MIAKDLLLILDFGLFYVINTSKYNLIRKIDVPNFSSYILNKNILLTGDDRGIIIQLRLKMII